jgi:hypothetical protein
VRPLTLDEIVGIDTYEAMRDEYRARVMALKRNRRLPIGDRVTLVFENRETLRFQVQEMLRVERTREPDRIQRELDVYNELIPGDGELSATLMIEITDLARIRPELDRLIGLDEHVHLVLGVDADETAIRARFDEKQLEDDRLAAVQYIKFSLAPTDVERLRDTSTRARIRIDQENYYREAEIPPEVRHSLIEDLAGDPEPLLRAPEGGGVHESADPVLLEEGRVRVRRPIHPAGPGHVVVEPLVQLGSWLDADDQLSAELMSVVRRCAREVFEEHGACRVVTDLHARGTRWHVFAPER